jgi:predicted small integral membrane protein
MDGTTLRIENSSRTHAESLHRLLADFKSELVQQDGAWQVEVELGELAALLLKLFGLARLRARRLIASPFRRASVHAAKAVERPSAWLECVSA